MLWPFLLALLTGFPASAYSQSIGENVHLSGTIQNFPFLEQLIEGMHLHSVRTGLSLARGDQRLGFLNTLAEEGITNDEIVSPSFSSSGVIVTALEPIDGVAWVEGPNEEDTCCHDAGWIGTDQRVTSLLAPLIASDLSVIAPAVNAADPAVLGDLSSEVTDANVHLYTGARPPETSGWGGVHFGQVYGSIGYNLAKAHRVGAALPVLATEEGYSSTEVSEGTQAAYVERATLWAFLHGVMRQWLYELVDDTQSYGVVRTDGSLKPVATGLAGLLQLTDDPTLSHGACTLHASLQSSVPYDTLVLCKSDGEKDLIVWQPAQVQDPNTKALTPAIPTNLLVRAPETTGKTVMYVQSPSYRWVGTSVLLPSEVSVAITERPLVVVFHAIGVESFPALPSLDSFESLAAR